MEHVDFVRNRRQILTDINLEVSAGEHWALIGANGAGKSTILSMCGAQIHPTRGLVHVLGHQLGRVELRWLRESIGHVNPRHPLDAPLTIKEVILTGATGTTQLMNRWQPSDEVAAHANELIDLLGLAELQHAAWTHLSQGERGRTLIARALITKPKLLLLDEPSTGLDVAAREQLLETVDALHTGRPELATVLVTHHLEELPETTTHAALLQQGRLLAAGPAREVLTTSQVSDAFEYPIQISYSQGRWLARATRTPKVLG